MKLCLVTGTTAF